MESKVSRGLGKTCSLNRRKTDPVGGKKKTKRKEMNRKGHKIKRKKKSEF